jgi:hypothetical protein
MERRKGGRNGEKEKGRGLKKEEGAFEEGK